MTDISPALPATSRAAPASESQHSRVPRPLVLLLILVILVPIEFGFNVGSLFFTWSKLYLVFTTFAILPHLGKLKFRSYDWVFLVHVLWTVVAFALVYGVGGSLERSGTYVLEFLIVYLAVRVWVTRLDQFRGLISLLFVMVLIATVAAVPEAFTGVRYIHDFATSVTGNRYPFDDEVRMGILRSASFFEHPILHGVFCSALLSLIWFTSTVPQRMLRVPVIVFGTWLSASSAPLLVMILQFLLIGLERVSRSVKRRVAIFGGLGLAAVVFLETFTGRGLVGALALLTLNPATAYTRRSQWNFGIDDVMRNPIFGFDPTTWTRPFWLAGSVDNYWLLMMMRSGIPSVLFLALTVLLIWRALARIETTNPLFRQLRIGWGLMMVALILGAATVAYFGKLQPLFIFYIGFGAALANCALPDEAKDGAAAPTEPAAPGPRYSRFRPGHPPVTDRPSASVTDGLSLSVTDGPSPPARAIANLSGRQGRLRREA